MDYKVSIFFTNGRDMVLVFDKKELEELLDLMRGNRPKWQKDGKSGFLIPLHNIMYLSYVEYTEKMKAADQEAIKKAQEKADKEAKKEEKTAA